MRLKVLREACERGVTKVSLQHPQSPAEAGPWGNNRIALWIIVAKAGDRLTKVSFDLQQQQSPTTSQIGI